jgi:hypothetical protein
MQNSGTDALLLFQRHFCLECDLAGFRRLKKVNESLMGSKVSRTFGGWRTLRKPIILTACSVLITQSAMYDIVRRSSIPEPLWGKWAFDSNDCIGKKGVFIAAQKYVNAGAECAIRAVSETAGRSGAKTLIIMPKDATHISVGSDFKDMKTLQKCDNGSQPGK